MAFQQSASFRPSLPLNGKSQEPAPHIPARPLVEESQEWILFSPSQAESSADRTRTSTSQTVGLSRISDLGSLNTAARSGRLESEVLDEEAAEDAELDSLDEGLHAFDEPSLFRTTSHLTQGPVLPTHDGLGTFPASSPPVLEQLWQHEHFNPKRKHSGRHHRAASIQRRLDTVEELEAQANDEKRIRIEKWRLDQSQAVIEEVQRETRRRIRREVEKGKWSSPSTQDLLGTTPKQEDYLGGTNESTDDSDPFWRRVTRRFIRDIIGIDEPLLSVILGESLPEDNIELSATPRQSTLSTITEKTEPNDLVEDDAWRDRLLERIARELGVFVHQISPHPGAFTTYSSQSQHHDYAGMPITIPQRSQRDRRIPSGAGDMNNTTTSILTPTFMPTVQDSTHAENWGFEEDPASQSSAHADSSLDLQRERQYWEQQLDVKMVFRYLRDRFIRRPPTQPTVQDQPTRTEEAAKRTAIIRQHHPLVARAQRSPARMRRDSRLSVRRPASSCASESSRKASLVRSASSSRNYWDIGGSVGSGSLMASGGAWGEV